MLLLTGWRGFIGARVVRRLEADGVPFRRLEGDVRQAASVLEQARGCDAIVHVAFRNIDRGDGFAVNPEGTAAVAQAAAAVGARVVALSTVGVYGHGRHVDADETTPLAPDTEFSKSRAEAERVLVASGVEHVRLRHRFVYGPGDAHVVPRLYRAVTRAPFLVDRGAARLSFVHVDDLARVIVRAAAAPLPAGEPVFHVTDGAPQSLRAVADALVGRFGGRVPARSVPYGAVDLVARAVDAVRGSHLREQLALVGRDQTFSNRKLLAWLPELAFVPFADGLASVDDLQAHRS